MHNNLSLLPCPHCHARERVKFQPYQRYNIDAFVVCMQCGMQGPCYRHEDANRSAIASWNKLPRQQNEFKLSYTIGFTCRRGRGMM